MASPVVHFEVMGKDGPALRRYYSELFGWQFEEVPDMDYGVVRAEEGQIGGGVGSAPSGGPSYTTFYVQVDDLEGALEKAQSLGGSHLFGPREIPGGSRIALFSDPEGHVVGLYAAAPSQTS
ncbi:MAG: VOC family protein [Actinomycetota bacterium]|nr:VOC family protein [Actinomycetota bacterium]